MHPMKAFIPSPPHLQPIEQNPNPTSLSQTAGRFISYISPKYHETLNRVRKYSSFSRVLKFSRGTSQILSISTCRKLKTIQKCDFEFLKCTDHELVHLSRALSNIKSLQHLTLQLQDCEVSQKNGFFSLFKQLKKLSKTSSVQLKFIWCKISDNELTEFSKALRLQRGMHKLSISFQGREMFTEKGFSNFTAQLSKYIHLRDLRLCMDYFQNINEKKVFQLFEALSTLTELNNLKIKICHRGVNNACLEYLSNSLKQLTRLEELELAFQSCYKVENNGLEALAFALPNLTAIKSVSFDFSWCEKISLPGIKSLVHALSQLEQLENLKLDIRGCNKIDDVTLSILWAAIASFSMLNSLNVSLGDGKMISASGFSSLHTHFSNLTQLTQLKLMFDVCKFMDDSILASVSKSLSYLENLTDLVVLVHLGGFVSDIGITEVSKIFSTVKKLKSLRLHFYMYKYIGSDGFSTLSQVLPQLEDLESLTINFSWSNIGNQGITNLGLGIANMVNVKKLKLSFYSCKDIGDESLKHLIEAITSMKDLEVLTLDFGGCNVTHKGIYYIADRLCHFNKLDMLDLNFSSCRGIGDRGVGHICYKVREMKSLTSLNLDFESTGSLPLSKDTLKSITNALPKLEYFSFRASSEGFIM